ncbi:glycosyltransferase family 4 protein [Desulfocurvus sp.]|uniref:glycosyltransferase family 4 protein n=1 Tax=Desulfocurvus sp. TaxID=2871698 RepID=UPI0025C0C9CC|nr:glycosyltransferase family 4 protein [Desulfocurvus sp.]MCK9240105.1 glycosyltransferase family 4 protein [Desulfocurvus sp.]
MRRRVLHVHTLPVVSGSGLNTFLSMRGLDPARWEAVLACAPGGRLEDLVRGAGLGFVPVPDLVQPVAPGRDVRAVLTLAAHLRRERYDVVHTHNSKAGFVGRLAARLAGVPRVVHTVHGFAFHDREPAHRRALFRALERRAARWCARMIFISRPLMDWAARENIVCPGGCALIPSGIELERFRPVDPARRAALRARWGVAPGAPVAGIVAKLWEGKGHDVLLDAFAAVRRELPGAVLMVVGEGHLRAGLEARAEALGLSGAVVFTGFLDDVAPAVGAMDVSVLPSLFEGLGRVLLEAMAMGLPVVASRVGGIPDAVADGLTGLLVPPGDAGALAGALLAVLGDPALAARMGAAGRARVGERFEARAMAASIEREYLALLGEERC